MRRVIIAAIMLAVILTGCSKNGGAVDGALDLRQKLQKGNGCMFHADLTADYGDRCYSFEVNCIFHKNGQVDFEIVAPESISGISGSVSETGGKLIFDDNVLLFESLTNGQVSPAIGPWLMMKAISSGYISSGADVAEGTQFQFDDTFQSERFKTLVTVSKNGIPVDCEIYWNNRRILTIRISNYESL